MTSKAKDRYFDWLLTIVCRGRCKRKKTIYKELLLYLYNTDFTWTIPRDENRSYDGLALRQEFTDETGLSLYFDEGCKILELMVALARRCENILADDYGDRTSEWFWNMIDSLDLGDQSDDIFDEDYVYYTIEAFLNREYESDGRGGLFAIPGIVDDLTEVELWYQMCWYCNYIIDKENRHA